MFGLWNEKTKKDKNFIRKNRVAKQPFAIPFCIGEWLKKNLKK